MFTKAVQDWFWNTVIWLTQLCNPTAQSHWGFQVQGERWEGSRLIVTSDLCPCLGHIFTLCVEIRWQTKCERQWETKFATKRETNWETRWETRLQGSKVPLPWGRRENSEYQSLLLDIETPRCSAVGNLIRFDPTNDDHQHWRFVQTIHGLAYLHWRGVGASADVSCRCQNRFESVEIQSITCRTLMNMALSNRMSDWDSLDARQADSLYSPGDPSWHQGE